MQLLWDFMKTCTELLLCTMHCGRVGMYREEQEKTYSQSPPETYSRKGIQSAPNTNNVSSSNNNNKSGIVEAFTS